MSWADKERSCPVLVDRYLRLGDMATLGMEESTLPKF